VISVLLELFGLLFFTYIAAVLSSTLVFLGVSRLLSTEKGATKKRVDNPVEKRRRCAVCGAHEWLYLDTSRPAGPSEERRPAGR
jgi:hypothetical protein